MDKENITHITVGYESDVMYVFLQLFSTAIWAVIWLLANATRNIGNEQRSFLCFLWVYLRSA